MPTPTKAETPPSSQRSRRHHTVPQFYLGRFADSNGKLTRVSRDQSKVHRGVDPSQLAVTKDFHTLTGESGEPTDALEELISRYEGVWASAFRDANFDHVLPRPIDATISQFVAFQFVRTTRWRELTNSSEEELYDKMLQMEVRTRLETLGRDGAIRWAQSIDPEMSEDEAYEMIETVLEGRVHFRSGGRGHFDLMLQTLDDPDRLAPIVRRDWHVWRAPNDLQFVTSDAPVSLFGSPLPSGHAGVGNAEEIGLPLDPSHFLLMSIGNMQRRRPRVAHVDLIRELNRRTIATSGMWWFCHTEMPIESVPTPAQKVLTQG